MKIQFSRKTQTFHLQNESISYIMKVLPNGHLGQLYFGEAVTGYQDYDYLLEPAYRPMTSYVFEGDLSFSLEHVRQEYPSYGTGDYRHPAIRVCQNDGSTVSDLRFDRYDVTEGKPPLQGLPATYCENPGEAKTLHIFLKDPVTDLTVELLYTLFAEKSALARSARIINEGKNPVRIEQAMSLCLDLPDSRYDWIQLSGAWARERHIRQRRLEQGIQSVESTRGHSSHQHNPFVVLKRPETTEFSGEAIGFSLIYSGNFLAQAEVDTFDVTRFMIGINPFGFSWNLEPGEELQLPEAVMVYTNSGLNSMSQTFHALFRERLARGYWRDRPRPVLFNSWECLTFNLEEEKLCSIVQKAKECGAELFVLDDGWFKKRTDVCTGLGDWDQDRDVFADGLKGFADRVRKAGLQFGLWIEPEMVNRDSDLFRRHPDWVLQVPGRSLTHGRNEFVLDYSRGDVIDYLFSVLKEVFERAQVSYVKWDMNRSITEAYSALLPPERQGEVMHRYILGVYKLYERLNCAFPKVLFESCASGGGRFDPGMLYYAPQGWTSDDSDAVERIKIQYGTSLCYPLSSMGAHISASPNQQVFRETPLHTRANVAFFGSFGYELDPDLLSEEELAYIRTQTEFVKKYRELVLKGTFYRLKSPFESSGFAAWMVVSSDKRTAVVGWYKFLNEVNGPFRRVKLRGLDNALLYQVTKIPGSSNIAENSMLGSEKEIFTGDELMKLGLITSDSASGELRPGLAPSSDFDSRLYVLLGQGDVSH